MRVHIILNMYWIAKWSDSVNKEKKVFIDNLWMESDLGKWCLLMSEGKTEDADGIVRDIVAFTGAKTYMGAVRMKEKEVSEKMIAAFKDLNEYKEYMLSIEAENADLVGVLIAYDIFSDLEDTLTQK